MVMMKLRDLFPPGGRVQGAAVSAAGSGDFFERDGLPGQFGADRSAEEPLVVEHADLGEVAGVGAHGDRFADVGGQHRVEVAVIPQIRHPGLRHT